MRVCLLFLFCSIGAQAQILLAPGEKYPLKSPDSLWIEDKKVVKAIESTSGFVLIGGKAGQSQIRTGKNFQSVTVLNPAQHQTYKNLKAKIPQTLNLSVAVENGQVAVRGRLVRIEDWLKLTEDCRNSLCKFEMHIEANEDLKQKIQGHFQKIFQAQGLPQQKILFSNPLSVQLATSEFSEEISKTLRNYGIKVISLKNSMEMAPLVRVQITIAEIKRDETLKYGISWPGSYSAQVLPKISGSSEPTPISLNMLEQNGLGKVLASPNLLCRSGKEAEFVAGGEFPIKIMNYKMQDVIWKRYGIVLKVKPVADFSGRMSISIETEVSSIDDSHMVDGIPGLFTNKVQSHFDLAESRVIALSGLIKSEQGKASQGIPGLGRIPILGALFASKEFRENRTELVIFVKPEIVNPNQEEMQ